MKNLRKLAGVLILFVLVFMVLALFQFQQKEEEMSILPEKIEHYLSEVWTMISLKGTETPATDSAVSRRKRYWRRGYF